MATAFYTVRVENTYGEFMEFPYEYQFDPEDWEPEEFDPNDSSVQQEIWQDVMDDVHIDVEFKKVED